MGYRRAVAAVLALASAMVVVGSASAAARPSNFRIWVNGHALTAAQLSTAQDNYVPVPNGRLTLRVTWVTNLKGTGHRVIITSPGGTDRRRCVSGTSCVLVPKRAVTHGTESSWSIQIYKGSKLVSEKVVCLVGR
jgi:hypothetical protein